MKHAKHLFFSAAAGVAVVGLVIALVLLCLPRIDAAPSGQMRVYVLKEGDGTESDGKYWYPSFAVSLAEIGKYRMTTAGEAKQKGYVAPPHIDTRIRRDPLIVDLVAGEGNSYWVETGEQIGIAD